MMSWFAATQGGNTTFINIRANARVAPGAVTSIFTIVPSAICRKFDYVWPSKAADMIAQQEQL